MSSLLNIGVSGLLTNKAGLQVTGNNIANTDTPGFSRQVVSQSTQTPQYTGAGYMGSGAQVETVTRLVDEYAIDQLRMDTSVHSEMDTYYTNISQVDGLLADASTDLPPGMQRFFGSLHASADDPISVPLRQLVLSETESLTSRFSTIERRLDEQNNVINQQLQSASAVISSLASRLAELNIAIVAASGRGQNDSPNDLLDTRDELIRELSEIVNVNVVKKNRTPWISLSATARHWWSVAERVN